MKEKENMKKKENMQPQEKEEQQKIVGAKENSKPKADVEPKKNVEPKKDVEPKADVEPKKNVESKENINSKKRNVRVIRKVHIKRGIARQFPRVLKVAVIFLVVVLFGTVISRAASSMLTPVVETQYATPGTISYNVLADVTITGDSEVPVYVCEGLMIEAIYVSAGETVAAGDALLRVNADALSQMYLEKKIERKSMKMQYWYATDDECTLDEKKLAAADEEISELATLVENEGVVVATFGGMVSEVRQKVGSLSTEEAAIVLTQESDTYTLKVSITESQREHISVGDTAIVQGNDDVSASAEVTALYEETGNSQHYIAETEVSGDTFHIGDSVLVDIMHTSQKYDFVVPLSAVRSDANSSYVLVMKEKDTLLGTEMVATKVQVKVGESGTEEAGLTSSALTSDDKVIVISDKSIDSGDVVREK